MEKLNEPLEGVDDSVVEQLKKHGFEIVRDFNSNTSNIPQTSTKIVLLLSPANYIVGNLSNKIIFVPPVLHEVFLSDLKNCVVACSAQQIRMRRCQNLKLFNYIAGSVFAEQKCSSIKLYPFLFHAENDDRQQSQNLPRNFANFQSLDNPFNPKACFTVVEENETSFFQQIEDLK
uniref:C-CAP/cofactor C-like domain-containing protein n=1 Tax=Panagrolaimus sp. JU765 TaxID=591449 RepID=A0AC34QP15_9BILA